jgi:HPt (histidine-containing phosphotransfer) domain-containing protein
VEGPDVIRAEGSNTPPFRAVTAEAAAASGAGVFNPAELLETFMGNDELACSLLCRFILRTAGQIEGIAGLKAAEDWESARREAHTIRGAAYTMTGKELGKAAARLEAAFKNRDRGEMETGYGLLAGAFGCFRAEAEGFLKSRNSVSASGAAG